MLPYNNPVQPIFGLSFEHCLNEISLVYFEMKIPLKQNEENI